MYRKTYPNEPEKTYQNFPPTGSSCKFNEGVECNDRDSRGRRIPRNCESCGWNPKVASQRIHDIRVKLGIIHAERSKP